MITKSKTFAEKFNLLNETSLFSLEFSDFCVFQKAMNLLDKEGLAYIKKALQSDELFNEFKKTVKSIEKDQDFFSDLIKVYLNTRETYTHFQNEIKCYHASLFKYIYISLLSLEAYNYLIENSIIDSLDVLIFTTQSPELLQGEEKNHRNNPFFKSSSAFRDYYKDFLKLTDNESIKVSRFFLISEKETEVMISRQKMITQFCKNKKTSGKCNECIDKCSGYNKRIKFLSKNNIEKNNFDLSIIDEIGHNPEFRDFIAFKLNDDFWDLAFSTNLLNSSTSLFLKTWDKNYLKGDNYFPFLGNDENLSFKKFIEDIRTNRKMDYKLEEMWGMNKKKKTITLNK